MSEPLFKPGFVYPRDGIGDYVDLSGEIDRIETHTFDDPDDPVKVYVKTSHGVLSGWTSKGPTSRYAREGKNQFKYATLRVYRSGGGFYPDDRIHTMSTTPL